MVSGDTTDEEIFAAMRRLPYWMRPYFSRCFIPGANGICDYTRYTCMVTPFGMAEIQQSFNTAAEVLEFFRSPHAAEVLP